LVGDLDLKIKVWLGNRDFDLKNKVSFGKERYFFRCHLVATQWLFVAT